MNESSGSPIDDVETFEGLARNPPAPDYTLRLYVAGTTPRSGRAIRAIKRICEEHLAGRYHLEVIDVYQQPALAEIDQILAVPTLVKRLPTPVRCFIGDLSATDKILLGLDLMPERAA
jgi:circadian clock protein KaiB